MGTPTISRHKTKRALPIHAGRSLNGRAPGF
jgi:hypothetical protein